MRTCPTMLSSCPPLELMLNASDIEACKRSIEKEGSISGLPMFAEKFQHPNIPGLGYFCPFPDYFWTQMDELDAKEKEGRTQKP